MFNTDKKIYSVSQLNTAAKMLLEEHLPLVWVEGEISNLAQPSSGHIYFSLKDEFAQVRCAMFRNQKNRLNFEPENGMQVIAQAQVSIYEARGDYQLIAHYLEPAGEGLLRQKFEQLKHKLQQEGLFEIEHKQTLPKYPQQIGVITSPTGAAVRDILHVLKRRFPSIPIIIYPTQVQGSDAKEKIVHAINLANHQHQCDLLILARGGGSLEDLWPFNEEIVARAIYNSELPIISGIGHEVDFTIADFVADVRAPTPSAAAEVAAPDIQDITYSLQQLQNTLTHKINAKIQLLKTTLEHLTKRLQHPGKRLQNYSQQLDNLEQRLNISIKNILQNKQHILNNLSSTLDAISPLATLHRGYSILTKDKKIIKSVKDVQLDDTLTAKLHDGELTCIVKQIN